MKSVFFEPAVDVEVTVGQTNGAGTFEGARTLGDRTVAVKGTFATPGHEKFGPCGAFGPNGSMSGSFEITTPV